MSAMDSGGNLTIYGGQCTTSVSATPRGTVNMFNISVSSPSCYNGPGILFYDSARRTMYALSAFYNGLLGSSICGTQSGRGNSRSDNVSLTAFVGRA